MPRAADLAASVSPVRDGPADATLNVGGECADEKPEPMRGDSAGVMERWTTVAVMRPTLDECDRLLEPLNDGERRVAMRLAELGDDWTVYVQPRLAHDVPDFVAVHPRHGVCAIEVKNWRYGKYRQNDDGSIDMMTDGAWRPTKEAPRYQAYRYRSTIFDHYFAGPDDPDRPTQVVRAVVVLPNHSTEQAERLLERHRVTPDELGVRVLGGDALHRAPEFIVQPGCPRPDPASIARLLRHLREADAVSELRSPIRLSEGARNIATNPSSARRRRVRGPAGCGKSFGLAARAARLAAEGKRVLVLTFNTTLANYLTTLMVARCRETGANPGLVTCSSFHAFCTRVVEDAATTGFRTDPPAGVDRWDASVAQAAAAFEAGFSRRFDAVLVDEGQDFTLEWWNLLRTHVVDPDGEMLLVADPTQDVYDKKAWTDEDRMLGAGFSGPWTELRGSYRMPADLIPLANAFARRHLDGQRLAAEVPPDHMDIAGLASATLRRWTNVGSRVELGPEIGHEVVRLLTANPDLNPNDVVFLCEHHEDGLAAVRVIEAAGYPVHHIFAARAGDRARRKRRFWPDAPGVKGCTVHSFKGWETPALVMGIDRDHESRRLAYVAMTRVKVPGFGRHAHLSIVNLDLSLADFQSTFEHWTVTRVPLWAPPRAEARVR